jgi:dipeptidase D
MFRREGRHGNLEDGDGWNAVKILNRVLLALSGQGVGVSSIEGGNKRNAIPRECVAVIVLPQKNLDPSRKIVTDLGAAIAAEFSSIDPDLKIDLKETPARKDVRVMKKTLQEAVTRSIAALPHGVIKMSPDIPGLVETSTNLAVIHTTEKGVLIETSQRSSVGSEILEIQQSVKAVFALGGASISESNGYPGWKPNLDSPVLKIARETFKGLFGKDPEIKAIHAGLECGIIGEKYPGMDMVSFGPTLEGVHSPDEKIHIDTVGKFYKLVLAILKKAA